MTKRVKIAQRECKGIATVEFAIAAPLLMLLMLASAEMARFVILHQKVDRVAVTTSDLVARAETIKESELDDILARAQAWQARDDRVDIIDKKTDDHGMLAITSIYVKYLLPMMVEIQWWDYKSSGLNSKHE